MNASTANLFAYVLNALWQMPLVFAGAWLAARLIGGRRPQWEHSLWIGALTLSVALPAWNDSMSDWLGAVWHAAASMLRHTPQVGKVTVVVGPVAVLEDHARHLPVWVLEFIAAAYMLAVGFFAARLAWRLAQTMALRRRADAVTLTAATEEAWRRSAARFAINDAQLAESAEIFGPVTIGVRHRMLLLPAGWLTSVSAEDLEAVFAHEFAHMRRHDFAKNLAGEVLALPIAWHPLLPLLRARIAEGREMLCDALAADALNGRATYARSLLRLASNLAAAKPARTLHAIGIFDTHIFERRLMQLTHTPSTLSGLRRIAVIAACIALTTGVCASAVALRVVPPAGRAPAPQAQPQTSAKQLPALAPLPARSAERPAPLAEPAPAPLPAQHDLQALAEPPHSAPRPAPSPDPAPAPQSPAPATPSGAARISAGVMEGQILFKVNPVYPDIAKAAGVEGTVILHARIGADGGMEALEAISGPQMLMGAAIDAVRQWKYRPYLLNGQPTEVDTTIKVTFSLEP